MHIFFFFLKKRQLLAWTSSVLASGAGCALNCLDPPCFQHGPMESGQFECCIWLHAVVQGKFVGTQISAKNGFMSHIFHTERKYLLFLNH